MMSSVVQRSAGLGRKMWWMRCWTSGVSCTGTQAVAYPTRTLGLRWNALVAESLL